MLLHPPDTPPSKQTLMDVIAARKNTGVVGGTICLNGGPATKAVLARVTAYAEQVRPRSQYSTQDATAVA
jgi:hypothetical protein